MKEHDTVVITGSIIHVYPGGDAVEVEVISAGDSHTFTMETKDIKVVPDVKHYHTVKNKSNGFLFGEIDSDLNMGVGDVLKVGRHNVEYVVILDNGNDTLYVTPASEDTYPSLEEIYDLKDEVEIPEVKEN